MKNKKVIGAVALGLATIFLVFAWLFWGSDLPEPTDEAKKKADNTAKAAVYNTVLNRDADGKRLWELKVGEAVQTSKELVTAKDLEGTVYLKDGDEMHVRAEAGEVKTTTNEFRLTKGVTVRLKRGGFLRADRVEWDQKSDILTAEGAVRVVKEDMLITAEKAVTSSKLKHFKLQKNAHVERGGHYEEK